MDTKTYTELVAHLDSKEFNDINNSILKKNSLNKIKFKKAVPYVLNKLNNLYCVKDGESITPELLSGTKETNKFAEMVGNTEEFKTTKLPALVDYIVDSNNINWCLMHGTHTEMVYRVPDNVIVVLMAPTNRVLVQYKKNYDTFVKLVNDKEFVRTYLKNPNSLSSKNYCFKYTTILYPGQMYFDLNLTGPYSDDLFSDEMGFFIHNSKSNTISKKPTPTLSSYIGSNKPVLTQNSQTQSSVRENLSLTLNERDSNKNNSVYFIYACRGCNLVLQPKLVEVLYYNEYVCNFINKNKCMIFTELQTQCNTTGVPSTLKLNVNKAIKETENNSDILCKEQIYRKIPKFLDNDVPALNFTPINKNNKAKDVVNNFVFILMQYLMQYTDTSNTLDTLDTSYFFKGIESLKKGNHFFENIIDSNQYIYAETHIDTESHINESNLIKLYIDLFNMKQYDSWVNLFESFFNTDGMLIYEDDIINIYNNYIEHKNNLLLKLILGQFIIYYFLEISHKESITDLINKIHQRGVTFETFIFFPIIILSNKISELRHILALNTIFKKPIKLITFAKFINNYDDIKKKLLIQIKNLPGQNAGSKKKHKLYNHKTKKINK